ncbi:MAG: efflux RND transporter periplasmic adaptor subunit, partial [Thermodesulfobacteriota bacterium]
PILIFSRCLFLSPSLAEEKEAKGEAVKSGAKKGAPKAAPATGPGGGMPPAMVVLGSVSKGEIAPQSDFVGTVYFQEVSELAAEVRGKVLEVLFEEGQKVKEFDALVKLDSDLLNKEMEEISATHGQISADLERAEGDFKRIKGLYEEKFVSEQAYDENYYKVQAMRKQAASLRAKYEGLKVELEKKTIRAPFAGVVLKRVVDRGEWLEAGTAVATIAKFDAIDIIVQVPEAVIRNLKIGRKVTVRAGGKKLKGKVVATVPSGDIRTRTFPVKVRVSNSASLMEGMEARVSLPTGKRKKALIVERDAVIKKFNKTVVFAVVEGKAQMLPVKVIGFSGSTAGIEAEGLSVGMQVVTKGNERLNHGQPISTGKPKSKK